jgi:transposase
LDLAKNVFQVHGANASGAVVFRKKLRRDRVFKFLAAQPACTVAMEACASSHYWGREIAKLGHEVRLIAPDYVKPFVKRQKNDAADAEAICEATQRAYGVVCLKLFRAPIRAMLKRSTVRRPKLTVWRRAEKGG